MIACHNVAELAQLRFNATGRERIAHFSSLHGPVAPWLRQTPAADGLWAGTQFVFDAVRDDAQWLVVCDDPAPGLMTRVPVARRILFLGEPPAIKRYPARYLAQYGTVVGPLALPGYRGVQVRQHAALPWHLGKHCALSWQALAADKPKSLIASLFCSTLRNTPQQVRRLAFVDALAQRLGDRVARFGHGFHPLVDKAEGINPYRYHLALENNVEPNFWTEKLADAYLGDSFPIHAGGSVAPADFPADAMVAIDLSDIGRAVETVAAVITSDRFERSRELIRAARIRVMTQHNLFAVADRIIAAAEAGPPPLATAQALRPSAHGTWAYWRRAWRNRLLSAQV